MVICEQVLEHVADPCAARQEPGPPLPARRGVIVSTPFLIRVHELPAYGMRDYWRFTPRGLQTLLERAGLEVEHGRDLGERAVRDREPPALVRVPALALDAQRARPARSGLGLRQSPDVI